MSTKWIKPLFILAGLYDGILGLAFVFFPAAIFQSFGVQPPNHLAYVQFPALLLLIFAAMFFRIARDPAPNRHLIPYGAGLKAAYSGTAFWYQLSGGIPFMWIPWAWADLAFLVLFLVAWRSLRQGSSA
jgi:hypothetical protein